MLNFKNLKINSGILKKPVCLFLIVSFFLQSIPLEAKGFDLLDEIQKLFQGINLPTEVKLNEQGDIKLGSMNLFKCIYKYDIDNDGDKDCVNPFSILALGSDKTSLKDENGNIDIIQPEIPEICELKIPLPPEEENLSQEEKLALARACSDFRGIQKAAANTTYFAKKIFNLTDPLSDCLFLKNCKSVCRLSFGEIAYSISIFDIASMFLPIGWINTLKKIADFAVKLNEIKNIITKIKDTIKSVIVLLNDLLKELSYLSTFFSSLKEIIEIVDDGDFAKLLEDYSGNLFKFSQAKSEALSLIVDAQQEIYNLSESLKKVDGVKTFFGNDETSEKNLRGLKSAVNNFAVSFESIQDMFFRLSENGKFLDDLSEPKGNVFCPEKPDGNCQIISTIHGCLIPTNACQNGECRFMCPEMSSACSFPYPESFGTHKISISCPELELEEISVACPALCSFSCINPTRNGAWLDYFKEFTEKAKALNSQFKKSGLSYQSMTNPQGIINDYLDSLVKSRSSLIDEESLLFFRIDDGEKNFFYWTTGESKVFANNLEQVEYSAKQSCKYNFDAAYYPWGEKIKTIKNASLNELLEVPAILDNLAASGNNESILEKFASVPFPFFLTAKISNLLPGLVSSLNPRAAELNSRINIAKINLTKLNGQFSLLNNLWFKKELEFASDYVSNIKETKQISQKIINLVSFVENDISEIKALAGENAIFAEIDQIISLKFRKPAEDFLFSITEFENKIGKTIEIVEHFTTAIDSLQKKFEDFIEVKILVSELNPTLEISAVQITSNSNDILEGKVKFGQEGESFNEVRNKIAENPLSYLENKFNSIEAFLMGDNGIKNSLLNIGNDLVLPQESRAESKKIAGKCDFLFQTVFGDDEKRTACNAINLIFKNSPEEIQANCELLDYSVINNDDLAQKCQRRFEFIMALEEEKTSVQDFFAKIDSKEIISIKQWWKEKTCGIISPYIENGSMPIPNPDFAKCILASETMTNNLAMEIAEESFRDACDDFQSQRSTAPDCDYFKNLKKALKNQCFLNGDCSNVREKISPLTEYCQTWNNKIPDLTEDENSESEGFQNHQLEEAKRVCLIETSDLKTPLEEVMRVYSVLLAIKSGTLAYKGIKTSYEDAKKAYESAQKAIAMIKDLPKKFEESAKQKVDSGGLSWELLKCIPAPAIGAKEQTSPKGGSVCPNIKSLFSIIEANFGSIRDNLKHIDMARRRKEWIEINTGDLHASIVAGYPIKYSSVSKIYDLADQIKNRTQNLWALATALNFAAENCTCGQSFCKLPACISGVPLTPEPLTEPYCYLTYILRYPMLHQVDVLENYLKK